LDAAQESPRRGRYRHRITPHVRRGTVYSRWIDFRLRIRRVSSRDSGTYTFHATSPSGSSAHRLIHVDLHGSEDLSTKRSRKRKYSKKRKFTDSF